MTTRTSLKNKRTNAEMRAEAIRGTQDDTNRLMNILRQRLNKHHATQSQDPCWGGVGDNKRINALLCEIAGYIDPDEPDCDYAREALQETLYKA